MKRKLIGILIILFVFVGLIGCSKENSNELKWMSYKIVIKEIREECDEDNFLKGSSAPEGQRYIVVEIVGKDESIKCDDINDESVGKIVIVDANGNESSAIMSVLHNISFDSSTFTFNTEEEQEGFDLVFLVDENSSLESLKVKIK